MKLTVETLTEENRFFFSCIFYVIVQTCFLLVVPLIKKLLSCLTIEILTGLNR